MNAAITSPHWHVGVDLAVVGSGVAGLNTALAAAALGLRVLVISKADLSDSNTRLAQGGVAVVLPDERDTSGRDAKDPGAKDTVARHIDDTIAAGAGLCEPDVVAGIVAEGAEAVTELRGHGATFDLGSDGRLAKTREGGHTAFRVIHAGGDATGAEVERALVDAVRKSQIALLDNHVAVDILRAQSGAVAGLLVLDDSGIPGVISAPAVVLATGGLGQLYHVTSNSEVATGDGIALALRAGALVSDIEFIQFHPTVLFNGPAAHGRHPLVTEALRGEGAVLVDRTGARIMAGVHPLADLAPRDVVSATITQRMNATGADHVFLDATHLDAQWFRQRFPTVHAACVQAGIDQSRAPIPVAPAAHFSCGGVVTTMDGRTSVVGLYAVGEVARTGLHGANRLASNSILEGLVVGRRTARAIADDFRSEHLNVRQRCEIGPLPAIRIADRYALQQIMSRHCAIGRSAQSMAIAHAAIAQCTVVRSLQTRRDVEDAALTLLADLVLTAGTHRTESRGCHVRLDYPNIDDARWRRSIPIRFDASSRPWVWDADRSVA